MRGKFYYLANMQNSVCGQKLTHLLQHTAPYDDSSANIILQQQQEWWSEFMGNRVNAGQSWKVPCIPGSSSLDGGCTDLLTNTIISG